jgi:hypothetical protein
MINSPRPGYSRTTIVTEGKCYYDASSPGTIDLGRQMRCAKSLIPSRI